MIKKTKDSCVSGLKDLIYLELAAISSALFKTLLILYADFSENVLKV